MAKGRDPVKLAPLEQSGSFPVQNLKIARISNVSLLNERAIGSLNFYFRFFVVRYQMFEKQNYCKHCAGI